MDTHRTEFSDLLLPYMVRRVSVPGCQTLRHSRARHSDIRVFSSARVPDAQTLNRQTLGRQSALQRG
eukprot:10669172-Alexandrium_andersonii.AAC.1